MKNVSGLVPNTSIPSIKTTLPPSKIEMSQNKINCKSNIILLGLSFVSWMVGGVLIAGAIAEVSVLSVGGGVLLLITGIFIFICVRIKQHRALKALQKENKNLRIGLQELLLELMDEEEKINRLTKETLYEREIFEKLKAGHVLTIREEDELKERFNIPLSPFDLTPSMGCQELLPMNNKKLCIEHDYRAKVVEEKQEMLKQAVIQLSEDQDAYRKSQRKKIS